MATAPTGGKSHTGRNIGIIIVALVVVVVGYHFLTLGSSASPPTSSTVTSSASPSTQSMVTVTGSISTTACGTDPISVSFTSDNNQSYTALVVNGTYSISLPNNQTYSMQVSWYDPYIPSTYGEYDVGSVSVNQGPGNLTLTENWSC